MDLKTVEAAIANIEGGTFVGLDTQTVVRLKGGKKNPMQGRVTKVMEGANVMCFTNQGTHAYDAMVKRRLVAEGKAAEDFTLSPRAWGERVPGKPLVTHKGKHYLEVIFLSAGDSYYLLDGAPIAEHMIEGLDTNKPEGKQGGLDNKVVIRTFALDSVIAMRTGGKEWK